MHELLTKKNVTIIDVSKIVVGDVIKITFKKSKTTQNRGWFYRRTDIEQLKCQAYAVVTSVYEDRIVVLMAESQRESTKSRSVYDELRELNIKVDGIESGMYDVEVMLKRETLQEDW